MARKCPLIWIPDPWKEPLKTLLSLAEDDLARIADSIRSVGVPPSTNAFVEQVATRLDPRDPNRLVPAVSLLVSLEMTRSQNLTPPHEFAGEVTRVAQVAGTWSRL